MFWKTEKKTKNYTERKFHEAESLNWILVKHTHNLWTQKKSYFYQILRQTELFNIDSPFTYIAGNLIGVFYIERCSQF